MPAQKCPHRSGLGEMPVGTGNKKPRFGSTPDRGFIWGSRKASALTKPSGMCLEGFTEFLYSL